MFNPHSEKQTGQTSEEVENREYDRGPLKNSAQYS